MNQPIHNDNLFPAEAYRIPFVGRPEDMPPREVVGSKAHSLMRLARCGLDVPAGFVLPTSLCRDYLKRGKHALVDLDGVLQQEMEQLGALTGRHFGDAKRPLLVSIRSGAAVSMPGMMETILNIGLNPVTSRGLIRMTGNPRLAADCQRRLIQQFAETVHGVAPAVFDKTLASTLAALGLADVSELDTPGLQRVADVFLDVFDAATGRPFPKNPFAQLKAALAAVLRSWSSDRAKTYRKLNAISDDLGTATLIQTMVFGNTGPLSGAGVGFTRSPADGSRQPYIDFLPNAQGEDVVAGRRKAEGLAALEHRAPDACRALLESQATLEREFGDMQDFEFTVEAGRLFILQSRTGKRTPLAALRIAHDLVVDGLIGPAEAVSRLKEIDLPSIETMRFQPESGQLPVARGVPASTGVTIGVAVLDPTRIPALKGEKPIVLLRINAETNDIKALSEVDALVTAEGARTSHAAVVARQLGKTCVIGCESLSIDAAARSGAFGTERVKEGDMLSVDGATGDIFRGEVLLVRERPTELLKTVQRWQETAANTGGQAQEMSAGVAS